MTNDAITDLDALSLSHAIHARQVSCVEVMRAYLARIHRLNPRFTAIVNLAADDLLLAQAAERDAELDRGASRGWMHGMPQAIKDASSAIGFPTTFGSPLLKDSVARVDSIMVERMKAAGCIVIGKTNMPEFGLGSHTYNNLFGTTGNAWDPSVSAGGSSGGAAVCLAQRMLPVADGSDFMGSLRNPAGWNNVFGMRPSQGRVPYWPTSDVWVRQLATAGPMARTVRDLAQLLSTQAGYDPRTPLSIAQGPTELRARARGQRAREAHRMARGSGRISRHGVRRTGRVCPGPAAHEQRWRDGRPPALDRRRSRPGVGGLAAVAPRARGTLGRRRDDHARPHARR